jgi:3-oxoadipate enol-lactonase
VAGDAVKPTLVLSGSLGLTTAMWSPQLDALRGELDVVAVDHPGHGMAPLPDGPVTVASIGERLLAQLPDSFSFCGLSLGGMVGMWLGANAPERVERLVLACTGASLGTPELYNERAALVRAEGTRVTVEGARERWFTPAFRDSPAAQAMIDDLLATSREGYAACAEAVGAFDFHGHLELIAAPTLVLYGEEDPVTPPDVIDALVAGIPVAEACGIPHAAHLANVEQPEAFTDAVLTHLRSAA